MKEEIHKLLDDYVAWFKDKTQLRQVDQWVEITTPYLDRHNDYIQIYARKSGDGYTLTDDGYTIGDLEQTGCKLNSPKRQELLKMTLNGFGVQLADQRLEVHTSPDNFALRKHNLVQAILAVNNIFDVLPSLSLITEEIRKEDDLTRDPENPCDQLLEEDVSRIWLETNIPVFFGDVPFEVEEDGEHVNVRVCSSYAAAEFGERRNKFCDAMLRTGHRNLYEVASVFQRRPVNNRQDT